jgi:DNA-binding MarR family transcriptional regulator
LILRERSEKDRRIVRLVITDKGSQLIKKIKKNRNERISNMLQGLTEEERDLLIKIYTKFS